MAQYLPESPLCTLDQKPEKLQNKVKLSLLEYSESSFTDPHTVVSFDEPHFDADAFSHIGKIYEGVEPYRMGGHNVVQSKTNRKECTHHFDPNYQDCFIVKLEKRTVLKTLCISTRFFAGNPASDLTVTLFDDLLEKEQTIPISQLKPDSEHWLDNIYFNTTRIALHFKAGGITRVWAFGTKAELQSKELTWLSKDSKVLFKEDDFFGGPNFALSQKANRTNRHMLGWETSRSAMGLQAVFPITQGIVSEIIIDTYRHVNNYLRSAWVFSAYLPKDRTPQKEDCPLWHITSSDGQNATTHDLKKFFTKQHKGKNKLPTYTITPKAQKIWHLETTFDLNQDAMHIQSHFAFKATHICIMLLPHGGLHAIKVMGTP
jgi:allantoicase